MKIINFKKHSDPIFVGLKKSWKEIAVFDLELTCLEASLIWTGWSIRQRGDSNPILQAPLLYHASLPSTAGKKPVIKIEKVPPALMLRMLRARIKSEYGILIPEPPPPKEKKDEK